MDLRLTHFHVNRTEFLTIETHRKEEITAVFRFVLKGNGRNGYATELVVQSILD